MKFKAPGRRKKNKSVSNDEDMTAALAGDPVPTQPGKTFIITLHPPRYLATLPRYLATLPRYLATPPRYLATLPRYLATLPRYLATLSSYLATLSS